MFTIIEEEDHLLVKLDSTAVRKDFLEEAIIRALEVKNEHIIIDMLHAEAISGIGVLKRFHKQQKKSGKSLIIVVRESLLEEFEDDFPAVPTYQEAIDFLEMENIERELGF
jgi:anti-anti-sigma regulatory factor